MLFCFFFFFVYAAHSTTKRNAFFSFLGAPCKCDQRTSLGAPITVVSAHPHTHTHTYKQICARQCIYTPQGQTTQGLSASASELRL